MKTDLIAKTWISLFISILLLACIASNHPHDRPGKILSARQDTFETAPVETPYPSDTFDKYMMRYVPNAITTNYAFIAEGTDRSMGGYKYVEIMIRIGDSAGYPVAYLINGINGYNSGKKNEYYIISTINRIPLSGWPVFMDSLKEFHLENLPDYHKIPGNYWDMDEGTLNVEITHSSTTKKITYPGPIYRKGQFKEVKLLYEAWEFMRRQFGITADVDY